LIVTDTARLATLLSASSDAAADCALLLIGSVSVLAPIVLAAAIGALGE
jgi:hypothetical protein